MKILEGNEVAFAEEFFGQYNKVGFGSMNKNDFEVFIFNLLQKYGDLGICSNNQASIKLHIPESKEDSAITVIVCPGIAIVGHTYAPDASGVSTAIDPL